MATITEDYVSFEVAKLLIRKGFDFNAEYESYYTLGGEVIYFKDKIQDVNVAPRITLQMAMKWLREVHHHIIEIHYGNVGSPREPEIQWWWELENEQGEFLDGNITDGNTTYEEAAESAIKYCLENLI